MEFLIIPVKHTKSGERSHVHILLSDAKSARISVMYGLSLDKPSDTNIVHPFPTSGVRILKHPTLLIEKAAQKYGKDAWIILRKDQCVHVPSPFVSTATFLFNPNTRLATLVVETQEGTWKSMPSNTRTRYKED